MNMKQITFLSVLLTLLTSVGETKITTKSFGDLGLDDKVVTGVTIDSGITIDTLKQNIKEAKSETEAKVVSAAKSATNYTDKTSAAVLSEAKDYANDVFKSYQPTKVDAALGAHTADTNNPHKVTASQVGVGLTNGVITIDGDEITPLTSESDPAWRAWKNGTSVALGRNAVYSSTNRMVVIGMDVSASNMDTVVIGRASVASGNGATVVGANCKATANSATAIDGTALGYFSTAIKGTASGSYSTAIRGTASGSYSTTVGIASTASGIYSTAVGIGTKARGGSSTAIGRQSKAYATNSVAIGYGAVASNTYAVAIGDGTPSEPYTYEYETIINEDGEEEVITNSSATVIGYAFAAGIHSTALGYMAYAPTNSLGLAYTPDTILLCSSNTTKNAGSTARSLRSYLRYTRKTLDAASFTAEDGVIYSLTLDDTMAASGIDVTLPESKDWVQDFILRLENPTTSATQFGDLGAAAIDYPNGKLTETGAIEAGTTNYFTFTETGAGRWMITSLPANK